MEFPSILRAQVVALLLTVSWIPAPRAQEVFTGTYTGTLNLSEVCPDSGGGPSAPVLTFTVTASATGFSGAGTFIGDEPGDTDTGSFTLEGSASGGGIGGPVFGQISVNPDDEDVNQIGQFEATFSDDFSTLELSIDAADDGPPNCTFHGNGIFTLVEGQQEGVVDPEETASSVVTAPVILKTQVQAISTSLTARINDVVRGVGGGPRVTANGVYQGISGLAAGGDGPSYGVWASYSYSDFDNDFAATALDGHRHNLLFGADMTPRDNMVLGFAVGYEFSSIDTDFNSGDQDTDGYTVAPYFGLILSDNWNVSASVGYSSLDTDQFRTDPLLGTRVESNPDSDRWFGTLNLNGYANWNDWLFTGRIGMLQARNIQESFDESDGTAVGKSTTELGQWNVGGEAAYTWGEFEPFARASYENDYSLTRITVAGTGPQPSGDDDNWLIGLGLRYFSSENGLSGNIEWYKRLGREDYDEDTFAATLRWDF